MNHNLKACLVLVMLTQTSGLAAWPHRSRAPKPRPDLGYAPVSPTASLEEREACWRAQSLEDRHSADFAWRMGLRLSEDDQRQCMGNANADEALKLMKQRDDAALKASSDLTDPPYLGLVLGLVGGVLAGSQQRADPGLGKLSFEFAFGFAGAFGGAVLGLGVGVPLWVHGHRRDRPLKVSTGNCWTTCS